METGLVLEPYVMAYIPCIGFITYALFKATPSWLSEARFGPLVSLIVGILVSVLDAWWHPFSPAAAVVRGLVLAAISNGAYDHIKAGAKVATKQ